LLRTTRGPRRGAAGRGVAPPGVGQASACPRRHYPALTITCRAREADALSALPGGSMTNPLQLCVLALAGLLCMTGTSARAADDNAPWVLDANNWQEGKDLLPEPVVKRLKDGQYWFKVVPVDPAKFRANYSKKFWDLSEANEGKFDVEANCGLKDKSTGKIPAFVSGLPFPKIDKSDPK